MPENSGLLNLQLTLGNQFEIQSSHRAGKLLSCPTLETGPRTLLIAEEIEKKKIVTEVGYLELRALC